MRRRHGLWPGLVALLLTILLSGAALADAEGTASGVPGWRTRAWRQAEGAPTPVSAIARTPDGYLWVGSGAGLYRFDGRRFVRVVREPGMPKSETVRTLLALPNGDLWVGHDWGGVSLVRNGRFRSIGQRVDGGTVLALAQSPDGTIVVVTGGVQLSFWRLDGEHWRVASLGFSANSVSGAHFDKAGMLWITAGDAVLSLRDGRIVSRVQGYRGQHPSLAKDTEGRVWVASRDAIQRLGVGADGAALAGERIALPKSTGGSRVTFDGPAHFWRISQDRGVERFALKGSGAAVLEGRYPRTPPNLFMAVSSDVEHNLWVGTPEGLDQYGRSPFRMVTANSGTVSSDAESFFVVRDGVGDVYFTDRTKAFVATKTGEGAFVGRVRALDSSLSNVAPPCPRLTGGVWQNTDKSFALLRAGHAVQSRPMGGARYAYACGEDGQGELWFWANSKDNVTYWGPKGDLHPNLGEDQGYAATQFIADGRDGVLFYVGGGYLWRGRQGKAEPIWKGVRETIGFIEVMYRQGPYVYFGGPSGLARYDGRRIDVIPRVAAPFLANLGGMTQTRAGTSWFFNADGLVGLKTADLDRLFTEKDFHPKLERYGYGQGLQGSPLYMNRGSLATDRWDRVWIATTKGVFVFDPTNPTRNTYPPPVHLTSLLVDDQPRDWAGAQAFGSGTSRITIGFDALSLLEPGQNQFRYRLDGVDPAWIDPGEGREVTYSHLRPGRYRFRVIAANNDGVWNTAGATLDFSIAPAFYQTWWFMGLCLVALVAIMILAVRLRVARVARILRLQEQQRTQERERISRELHDTLLQGVQGLIFSVDAAARRADSEGPLRRELDKALTLAESVASEARARVGALRVADAPQDLAPLIEHQIALASFASDVSVRLIDHWRKPLAPELAAEVAAIVGEAIANAARHARAKSVEITMANLEDQLVLTVSDDGVGLPDAVRRAGRRDGHFGLVGMAERAAAIGARLELDTPADGGALVRVVLPPASSTTRLASWWRALRARSGRRPVA